MKNQIIEQINNSLSSIFTKDDVINILNLLRDNSELSADNLCHIMDQIDLDDVLKEWEKLRIVSANLNSADFNLNGFTIELNDVEIDVDKSEAINNLKEFIEEVQLNSNEDEDIITIDEAITKIISQPNSLFSKEDVLNIINDISLIETVSDAQLKFIFEYINEAITYNDDNIEIEMNNNTIELSSIDIELDGGKLPAFTPYYITYYK